MLREGLFGVLPVAFSVIASHDADGVLVLRTDGRLVYANSQARALLAPLVLAADRPLLAVLARRLLREEGRSGGAADRDCEEQLWPTLLRPGGTLYRYGDGRWLRVSARPVHGSCGRVLAHCLRIHDATDEQSAERDRRQAQRLESVAELALGVADDFHNLLAVIRANAELLADQLPARSEIQRKVDKILRSGAEAAELADQLQLYAGAAEPKRVRLDLSRLVLGSLEAVDAERDPDASRGPTEVKLELLEGRAVVEADAAQLRQLVLDLVGNARDVLGERGGEIRIEVGRAHFDPRSSGRLVLGGDRPAAEYVHLKVSDTGPGIDPETQERIFEPFFSTKGKHRGIGLASVLGIARSHDALLGVVSRSGRGTCFSVYFAPAEGGAA
jgi:signal transduction histidine kinase